MKNMKNKKVWLFLLVFTGFLLLAKPFTAYAEEFSGKVDMTMYGHGYMDWKIDNEGKLTVTGEILSDNFSWYGSSSSPPWSEYRDYILSAEISVKEIRNVGSFFRDCQNLQTVDLSKFDTSHRSGSA